MPPGGAKSRRGDLSHLLLDHVRRLLDGGDLLGTLLVERDLELLLERHHDLDGVQGVGTEVDELGVGRDGVVSRTSAPACTRAPPPLLEGTASLEMLITEGPMRGLPVGRVLPLLLSPDAELRREVASAMRSLEHNIAHREVEVEKDKVQ